MHRIAICFLIILLQYKIGFAQESNWKLVWQDEFSVDGKPDAQKWRAAPRGKPDWACYCFDDTATAVVRNGVLLLKGIKATPGKDTTTFQTGCLDTKGLFSFLYGKLEVRAKLPQGSGSWPAIWLMPQESKYGGWPRSGEIDVMEHLNFDTVFYQTLHSSYIDQLNKKEDPKYFAKPAFNVGAFNVFGMEWYADRIDFFVNGRKTFSYPKIAGDSTATQWPFDQPFYIILNQALGGNWPGPVHEAHLPQQFEIDYVRVYQLQK